MQPVNNITVLPLNHRADYIALILQQLHAAQLSARAAGGR